MLELTHPPRSAVLRDEVVALAERTRRSVVAAADACDDVQVWVERVSRFGYEVEGNRLRPVFDLGTEEVAVRPRFGDLLGRAALHHVEPGTLRRAVGAARAGATRPQTPIAFPTPASRRPGPRTFDPELADALASPRELHRIAWAMLDNTLHEATRFPDLESFRARLIYSVRRRVVATRAGTAASLHAELSAGLDINGVYSEGLHQVHAPESFLHLALLGARTLRHMPRGLATPEDLPIRGPVPVVLHPRLFEKVLRRFVEPMVVQRARRGGLVPFREGEIVASEALTLLDDSTLDGLSTSRPFDDEGVPARRNALLVRGRLAQFLRTAGEAAALKVPPTASAVRRPRGRFGRADVEPEAGFFGLVVEPGDRGFHELVADLPGPGLLLHDIEGLDRCEPSASRLSCPVVSGVTLEPGRESRLLAPGRWSVSGQVLTLPGRPEGCLETVALSREMSDTGSAILPYCVTTLSLSAGGGLSGGFGA